MYLFTSLQGSCVIPNSTWRSIYKKLTYKDKILIILNTLKEEIFTEEIFAEFIFAIFILIRKYFFRKNF